MQEWSSSDLTSLRGSEQCGGEAISQQEGDVAATNSVADGSSGVQELLKLWEGTQEGRGKVVRSLG